jgi:hypothetical protein
METQLNIIARAVYRYSSDGLYFPTTWNYRTKDSAKQLRRSNITVTKLIKCPDRSPVWVTLYTIKSTTLLLLQGWGLPLLADFQWYRSYGT